MVNGLLLFLGFDRTGTLVPNLSNGLFCPGPAMHKIAGEKCSGSADPGQTMDRYRQSVPQTPIHVIDERSELIGRRCARVLDRQMKRLHLGRFQMGRIDRPFGQSNQIPDALSLYELQVIQNGLLVPDKVIDRLPSLAKSLPDTRQDLPDITKCPIGLEDPLFRKVRIAAGKSKSFRHFGSW